MHSPGVFMLCDRMFLVPVYAHPYGGNAPLVAAVPVASVAIQV
jgi:hypothetical protein